MDLNNLSSQEYNAYVQSKAKPSPMGKNLASGRFLLGAAGSCWRYLSGAAGGGCWWYLFGSWAARRQA